MASNQDTLKAILNNSRTRLILIFTMTILVVAMVFAVLHFIGKSANPLTGGSTLGGSPGIRSVPGALNPSAQYVKLQTEQNTQQAVKALQQGTSAIPTLVQMQEFGKGVQVISAPGAIGFVGLTMEGAQNAQSIWYDDLKAAHCSVASMKKAITQGAALAVMRKACSCLELKEAGYTLPELKLVCTCPDLKLAGYTAANLKAAGSNATQLKACGYSACDLLSTGFTPQELRDAGYSADELKGAGVGNAVLDGLGGLPPGVTAADVRKAGCDAQALSKLREEGVSASAIRRLSGCSLTQLKIAGFSAAQLGDAGFSKDDLLKAGFSPAEIAAIGLPPGVTATEVHQAGCDATALTKLREKGVSAEAIRRMSGCSAAQLKAAGYSAQQLRDGGYNAAELLKAGFTPDELKQAGFSAGALLKAGITPAQLAAAGYSPEEVQKAEAAEAAGVNIMKELPPGVSVADVRQAGCDPQALARLRAEGVNAEVIHRVNGCNASQLKAAGFTAQNLADAGFSSGDLLKAGYSPADIKRAEEMVAKSLPPGVTAAEVRQAGCDAQALMVLRDKGVSATAIHQMNGCSATQLKAAGFTAAQLAKAAFSSADLLKAGFSPADVQQAEGEGLPTASTKVADCSFSALRAAQLSGVSAESIRQSLGCSASALKAAGYTAAELKSAGYTAADLKNAGFTPAELKAAGFSAKDLKDAGFSARELKDAGFSAQDLKQAGFSATALKDAGFSAKDLKSAGFNAAELKAAGFSAADLKDAGFSAQDLDRAGFSVTQMRNAGFTASELKAVGVSAKALMKAGYTAADLMRAGIPLPTTSVSGLPDGGGAPQAQQPGAAAAGTPGVVSGPQQANIQQLQNVMNRQHIEMTAQQHAQAIQQRVGAMSGAGTQLLQGWKKVSTQAYTSGSGGDKDKDTDKEGAGASSIKSAPSSLSSEGMSDDSGVVAIKSGDITFAVMDTTVNTDEPSPILATIVVGKLKGSKLIGSFTLPPHADKMVIMFNSLSVPGVRHTQTISAFAIDPETGRTALSGRVDNHYLSRYGSMFAASFIEGFGNAFQSANTSVTIGGTGGGDNITVQNGINRSAMENAVIGLATVGKSWGQVAQQNVNRPVTIEVASGTGIGVLFTQDAKLAD
ncbi:MAG: type IVB secretion system protein DotG/IcmE [Gammaproteobacteria bacterium]|nr:type IVB secretion system protein DotG/IcmE [Gammaproteobacteria bacterium]